MVGGIFHGYTPKGYRRLRCAGGILFNCSIWRRCLCFHSSLSDLTSGVGHSIFGAKKVAWQTLF